MCCSELWFPSSHFCFKINNNSARNGESQRLSSCFVPWCGAGGRGSFTGAPEKTFWNWYWICSGGSLFYWDGVKLLRRSWCCVTWQPFLTRSQVSCVLLFLLLGIGANEKMDISLWVKVSLSKDLSLLFFHFKHNVIENFISHTRSLPANSQLSKWVIDVQWWLILTFIGGFPLPNGSCRKPWALEEPEVCSLH